MCSLRLCLWITIKSLMTFYYLFTPNLRGSVKGLLILYFFRRVFVLMLCLSVVLTQQGS